ncbi:tryptophan 7-halogenase [Amycolatopsis sp. 195334CR]|uniref:tryptophan 7-halogenase n=1 Tax=Amycolatopsis sp. 195334CR TaxID=2814588 RepID=UPI001A8C3DB6|nr:tryptophan 7-halogenase [Amycolatopsis sp. 195334CR]MBN6038361.1 tryptophan 7-halogenase [Amycolatopsis sp. 195334CR]
MTDHDVIVVGGGPGGSTAAGLTAAEGHRVLLLDQETFPRYQIGESLLPATVHGICAMLGLREEIERAGFVRKRGGTFRWGTNPEPWTFTFATSERMAGPTSYAYQVERTRFDSMLLDNAARLGADVRQGHRVLGTIREDGRVRGVRYLDDTGRERLATARFVVDASGHGSRLHQSAGGRREYSPHFRNLALFGYFLGGHRMPEPNSGNILCAAFDHGWFWYIPLSAELTSVGAVVKRESAAKVQGNPEVAYPALIAECPLIKEFLRDARRAADPPYDRLRVRKDYSYDRTVLWCPGLVLVGDAACFLDPVFSSGVHLATYSALLAARSINSALSGLVDEHRCFTEFEARYRREFGLFREFLLSFYETRSDEHAYFRHARRLTRHGGTAGAAFAELVGGVSSVDFSGKLLGEVLAEGAQLQLRGLLGAAAGAEPPMFPGGLVPTPDGRRWQVPDV